MQNVRRSIRYYVTYNLQNHYIYSNLLHFFLSAFASAGFFSAAALSPAGFLASAFLSAAFAASGLAFALPDGGLPAFGNFFAGSPE